MQKLAKWNPVTSTYTYSYNWIGESNIPKMEVPHMAANGKRVKITLSCTECKQRNYNTMKNKQNTPDRLEMNKYCRFCRKHTLHKESK